MGFLVVLCLFVTIFLSFSCAFDLLDITSFLTEAQVNGQREALGP